MAVVDLSRWQGVVPTSTFASWKSNGVDGVIVKAGGADAGIYKDSCHDANVANARAAYIPRIGHYFFNGPGNVGAIASAFRSYANPQPGDEMWLDIENEGAMPHWSPVTSIAVAASVKAQCGILPGFYMSSSVTSEDNWSAAVTAGIKLWVAQYFGTAPKISYWTTYEYWQYTSQGTEPNHAGDLDISTEGTRVINVAPANNAASINQTGHSTSALQEAINGEGYKPALVVDGMPGPLTEAGIKWVEEKHGLTVDGIAGPKVAAALWPATIAEASLPQIAEDGIRGIQTIEDWQEVMGTPVDGKIDATGSALIKADQEFLNSVVEAADIENLTGKRALVVDGDEGPNTIKVRQFWLFNKYCKTVLGRVCTVGDFDGKLGVNTNKLHQYGLNHSSRDAKKY